ncbi:MAG: endonuclease MutS2 [Clostridia bacterium]|nr:endonuclease MutS2 [Clostridia bacterium]
MDAKTLRVLEFNKIINMLKQYAVSDMGKAIAEKLQPSTDINEIKTNQKETSEAVSMILKKGSLGLGGLRFVEEYIKRVNIGGVLNIGELIHIGDFLRVSRRAKDYAKSESKNDSFPTIEPYFNSIETVNDLEREIERCIPSPTEIADDASRALKEIRRSIKIANDGIKEKLNSIIHSNSYKNMLQEAVITIRNERYCVPIKQEYKNSFAGLIHDQSATGATVFIEPISVVQLNNKIKELHNREKNEIERILALLSGKVAENAETIMSNACVLSHIDFVFAKGELSIKMNGTEPVFNTKGYVNIKKARHPLLDSSTVVPTDIYIGKKFNTLLITGPNTGGKTVSLKTLGLFTLMGQSGLHISAFDNSELAVFDNVFADIGDEQSIEQSLSTFSSHMTNIVKILDNITPDSLVLLDELGAGTDPTEGAALAIAIIKYLHALGARTAVTTHYSELKVFALSTEGVENASCEFDVETLRPTYKLLIGVPGKSNAFAISQRLGLPEYIINEAKDVLSHEDLRFEDVITDLEISRKSLIIEQEKAEEYRKEAQRLRSEAQNQRNKLEAQRERIIREANEKARAIISDAKDESDSIIKEMRKLQREGAASKALEEQRARLKDKMNKAESRIKAKAVSYKVPDKLVKGDRVKIHSLNQSGIVSIPPNKNGDVTIKAGIMTVTVNIKDLSLDTSEEQLTYAPKKFANNIAKKKRSNISAEVDLRGMLALEAIDKLDKYLDDAYLAGVSPVTIIHGKGTGALRKAVHEYLRTNPRVKGYRLGQYGEGEAGVTVVELR